MNLKKDSVTAKKINKNKIRLALEKRGIQALEINQLWRHVHAKVRLNGDLYFLKLASTNGIGRATRNEVKWNHHMNKHLSDRHSFKVPKIVKTGLIGDLYYYIAEFIDGVPLCVSQKGASTRRLLNNIESFASSFYEISLMTPRSFVWDQKYKNLRSPGGRFFKRAQSFYRAVDEREELIPLLEIAHQIKELYKPGLTHGDLTAWHMLKGKQGELILTDAEWASSKLPKYYDLAYCYHRLCTCTGGFKAAFKIASTYRHLLKKREKSYFEKAFRAVIAERVIGGYWDALKGSNTAEGEMQYHKRLRKLVIDNELF